MAQGSTGHPLKTRKSRKNWNRQFATCGWITFHIASVFQVQRHEFLSRTIGLRILNQNETTTNTRSKKCSSNNGLRPDFAR